MRSLLLFFLFITFVAKSQTLYWVGGSGNFNDPSHWSLTSGGPSANVVPGELNDLIFDNSSADQQASILIKGSSKIKSLECRNTSSIISFNGQVAELTITGSFKLNMLSHWLGNGILKFHSEQGNSLLTTSFGGKAVHWDVRFGAGNYKIKAFSLQDGKKLSFYNGIYRFSRNSLTVSDLEIGGFSTKFFLDTCYFYVSNRLVVKDPCTFVTNKFSFYLNSSTSVIPAGQTFGYGARVVDISLQPPCGATVNTIPSCAGSCTGIFSYTIDPSCVNSPYMVFVTNDDPSSNCQNTATLLSGTNVPYTNTISGACFCPGAQYNVSIFDPSFNTIPLTVNGSSTTTNFNFQAPSFGLATLPSSSSPSCNTSCNGVLQLLPSGGPFPYTITINPPIVPPFTVNGVFTLNSLCANVYTFTITDANGCSNQNLITKTVTAPPPINPSPTTSSVTCFGACNGSVVISPSGGTGSTYTVAFNPGSTFTVSAGGSASTQSLCPGAISATVTDVNGCTASTSTTIVQPTQVTITATQTNVSCFGLCNATASVSVTGGITPYTFSWTSSGSTTNVATGLCAGPHTVTIQNNNGLCVTTRTFNITQPSSITITPSSTNIVCPNLCTGAASVTSSGGIGAMNYTWVPTVGTNTVNVSSVTNLCAGSYTVIGQDVNTCTNSAVVTVTAPPAFTVTAASQTLACFGSCNGSATVTVAGANGPPYPNVVWTPTVNSVVSGGTITASNMCAGNYTLSISDGTCSANQVTIGITQPSSITLSPTTTSITCNGLCNGVIAVNPSGGSGTISYTLLTPGGGNFPNAMPPFTGLCAGVHTVIVQDQVPCSQSFTVNIAQPNPLVLSTGGTSVSCFGGCNGVLTGNVAGGVPGYTLAWNTGTSTVNGGILNGVCGGQTYTFSVTDANACTTTQTASVNQPSSGITVTITATQPTCFGGNNGALNALVAGGTPNYTLTWSNGGTGSSINGLNAGSYTLTVTDANGCSTTQTVSLTQPAAITATVTTSQPICAGGATGSATIIATGGTTPYSYNLGIATNTTGVFTGLLAGNYVISVSDANGCSQSINFSLTNPPALTASLTGLQSSCNACTGAATVAPSGGVPGYTVSWTNSVNVVVGTNSTVAGLCPGNHTATVTDANGCVATVTAGVVQTVSVTVVTGGTGILCFGACTGSAVANPIGGTAPYSYSWTPTAPTQTTQTALNLCANSYTVLVSDALGCSNTGTIALVNPPALTVNATQTNVTCFGQTNGAINATATGGTGSLTYSWSPGGQTTSSISNLAAGVYTLVVTDQNNCTATLTRTITENNNIAATFTTTQPTGCNVSNGSICVSATGGTGTYTYTWSPGASTGSCITNLGAGGYQVTIMDGAGCTATLSSALTNPSGPSITVATQSVNCNGGNTGSATVTATSGTAPFGYTWTPAVSFVNLGNTSTALSLTTGTYAIAVSDGVTGCITTQTLSIGTAPAYTVTSNVSNPLCFGNCNGSVTVNVSGGTPGYTYNWTGSGTFVPQSAATATGLCSGVYTLNITDQNLCLRTQTFSITNPPQLVLTNTATNVQCNALCNGSIVANTTGGTGAVSYSWLPVSGFSGSTTATVLNLCPNVYTVIATDGNNCQAVNTITITQPTSLTSNIGLINASCSNSCNATATLTANGGTPTYTFSWSGSGVTTSTISGLCAGTYSATVIDGNGCSSSQSFTITAPGAFTGTLTAVSPLCNAACNGSINTVLSGAQGTVSFNWAPSGSGQSPTNLCAGIYTLVATDAAGCQLSSATTLTNPPAVLANISFTNPSCAGICNGVAFSNPANTTGTINYSWTPTGPPTATTQSVNGLCGGTYSLTIQDSLGCTATQNFTLVNPQPVNLNVSSTPATCSFSNGVISVLATGGTPSYTFAWSPAVSTGSTASGLGAGVYTVIVNDANNCTNSVTIPMSNSNGPSSAPVTSTSLTCFNVCAGTASVNPASIVGGTPGYTISWVAPPSANTVNPQTNLCAGNYTAQVTDANGCILYSGVSITQPSSISINPTVGLPTCNGVCDGTVSLNTNGGTPGYSFNWSPGGASTETVTNLCAGIHTVIISDNNSCSYTHTVDLPAVQNIVATIASGNNLCFSSCSATAAITSFSNAVLPLNPPSWSNGQTGNTASSLCAGIYTVIVSDAAGCNNSFTTSISAPSQITATASVVSPSCNMCNGASIATANGGVAPYTYSWTSGSTSQNATNLCAGLYQVLITDNNGCTHTQSIPVSNSAGITGENFNILNESCNNMCDGSATVTAIGGTAPITYTWLTTPQVVSQTNSNLCADDYFVQMQDAQGCIRTTSLTVNTAPGLTLNPFVTPPDCGATNGSITVVATGGNGSYTYVWTPGVSTTSVLTNVGPGNYSVTVTSAGCSNTEAFTISNFNNPTLTYTQSNISCFNACTGSIVAVGSSTSGPVNYSWSTNATNTTGTLTGACAGVITLTVTSANDGCMAVHNFTLSENPPMQLSISNVQNVLCFGDCNGQITLIPSGGVLPYTFTWSPSGTANPQTSLCVGSYTGIVTDAQGCSVSAVSAINGPASALSVATNTIINSSCSSVADGSASVNVSGGTPTYTFTWSGTPTFTSATQNLNGVFAGTYTLNVVDQNNCPATHTVQIVPTITIVANAGDDSTFCTNGSITLNAGNSVGAAGGYVWIELPSGATVATTPTILVAPAAGSSTFVLQAISSSSSCVAFDTVVVNSLPLPDVDAGPSFTIPVYSTVTIGGNPTSNTGITFSWTPAFPLDDGTISNPVASNTVNTTYTITVTDANGCRASDTVQVLIYPEIKIPNGFSPNGDSRNDTWIIDNLQQFPDVVVEVYNRWGELLFYSTGYNVPFDGKYQGKPLPVGTYYYVINLNHPAYTKPYTGPLTIFR